MVAVSGPYWRADRREYYVQWRWNGMRLHVPISAAACGEDQATAGRVAQRVKELVQSDAGPEKTDAFRIYRDKCVAEEVAGTSDGAAARSAITVPSSDAAELVASRSQNPLCEADAARARGFCAVPEKSSNESEEGHVATSSRGYVSIYADVLQAALLGDQHRWQQPEGANLRSVLSIEPRWAALIFAGLMTQVVRSGSLNFRGSIGIAILGAPALIVGRVYLQDVVALTRDEIAERQAQTCVPLEELDNYLKGKNGFVYHLSQPFLFADPVPQVSVAQGSKGEPNEHEQMQVAMAARRITGSDASDVDALNLLFEGYKNRQALPDQREARHLSKRLKDAENPLPQRKRPLTPEKERAEKVNHELQRVRLVKKPRTVASGDVTDGTERDRTWFVSGDVADADIAVDPESAPPPNQQDFAVQVSNISALRQLE